MISQNELQREAAITGFQMEPLEKVIHLLELLESLRSHPFLKNKIALKGGTALNLFVFNLPRLSVDIDLNYIGARDREIMRDDRPKIEQAIQAVCGRLGMQVKRVPDKHAVGKWLLSYTSIWERPGTLELDVNFLLRTPLWPAATIDSHAIGSIIAKQIPVLDFHELTAGKLVALFDRNAPRDIFDACRLLREVPLDISKLRTAFVVYGGITRRDWRTISMDDIRVESKDVSQQLLPMLRSDLVPSRKDLRLWCENLAVECRALLSKILPFTNNEMEFLKQLNARGEILPDLVTEDPDLQLIVLNHPGLLWKAQNVREHFGRGSHDANISNQNHRSQKESDA